MKKGEELEEEDDENKSLKKNFFIYNFSNDWRPGENDKNLLFFLSWNILTNPPKTPYSSGRPRVGAGSRLALFRRCRHVDLWVKRRRCQGQTRHRRTETKVSHVCFWSSSVWNVNLSFSWPDMIKKNLDWRSFWMIHKTNYGSCLLKASDFV